MNAGQLQEAIDKTRLFICIEWKQYQTPLKEAQASAVEQLKQLEKIQAQRAALMLAPKLIQESNK
jgi:hypothetical protein